MRHSPSFYELNLHLMKKLSPGREHRSLGLRLKLHKHDCHFASLKQTNWNRGSTNWIPVATRGVNILANDYRWGLQALAALSYPSTLSLRPAIARRSSRLRALSPNRFILPLKGASASRSIFPFTSLALGHSVWTLDFGFLQMFASLKLWGCVHFFCMSRLKEN